MSLVSAADSIARQAARERFDLLSECANVPEGALRGVRAIVVDGAFLRARLLSREHGLGEPLEDWRWFFGLLRAAVPANTLIHELDGTLLRVRHTMQAIWDSYVILVSNAAWEPVASGGIIPSHQLQVTEKTEGDKTMISVCLQPF